MKMEKEADSTLSYKFPKSERLSSKKLIDSLFANGKSIFLYPYRIKYLPASQLEVHSNQFLISVPKKLFKRAVDRNLIKRRVKEAYRLHKSTYLNPYQPKEFLVIAYIYVAKEILDYDLIESKLIESLKRLKVKK
jgi:ribonuclease P protein component